MEKLYKKVQWENPQSFVSGGVSYLIFSIDEVNNVMNTGAKLVRTLIFSKVNGKILFQICETMGFSEQKTTILLQIKVALGNHRMRYNLEKVAGSNQLFFYNEQYVSDFSCEFKNGQFGYTSNTFMLSSSGKFSNSTNIINSTISDCVRWHHVLIYRNPDGEIIDYVILYSWDVCPPPANNNEEQVPKGGVGGGEETGPENENIDGVDNICPSSFTFQTINNTANGVGGWQVAGTQGIRIQIVNTQTGQYVPILLPTIYFGLPIIRSDGTFYSQSAARLRAAEAVEYGEQAVMDYYYAGGSIDAVGMTLLCKQK